MTSAIFIEYVRQCLVPTLSPGDIVVMDNLQPHKNATVRKGAAVAKYRNPKTGETWSGRGRSPAWLAGKNRERFLIDA